MRFVPAKRPELRFLVDWPRGRLGYLPWRRTDRAFAIIDKKHKRGARKFVVKTDLGKAWKDSQHDARLRHNNQFEEFLDTLIDDILHEVVHYYQSKFLRERQAEDEARKFAMYGRWTRR
jgi:O-methyltransferase involved in polyketide biosynthesis